MVERVAIFSNGYDLSKQVEGSLKKELEKAQIKVVPAEELRQRDLAIALGGDGAFLRMGREINYSDQIRYVGINTGTLGFLQEVEFKDIDNFVECIKKDNFKIDKVPVEITYVYGDENERIESINEVVIREENLRTMHSAIYINGSLFENFSGDGILVATSTGSTAYNLSFGGAVIDRSIETLQITPIAPINNRSYKNLLSSVITSGASIITLHPSERQKTGFLVMADGVSKVCKNVKSITIELGHYIHVLSFESRDYIRTINEKLLN